VRNWQVDAPRVIAQIHQDNPSMTPDDLRKELRKHGQQFSMGTSWGKKVWQKHCRKYLAHMAGAKQPAPTQGWPADIAFPFRASPPQNGGE